MSRTDYRSYFQNESIYDHEIDEIRFIETHISFVCLTGNIVYKVKKPVQMGGILDFRQLSDRQYYCKKEIELNSRFSPHLYYGIVGLGENKIVDNPDNDTEFAVKMKQLPQEALMRATIKRDDEVSKQLVQRLADHLVQFYNETEKVPKAGSMDKIKDKINENFATLKDLDWESKEYEKNIYQFLDSNQALFNRRQSNGMIVDGHGDLRPKNIFIINREPVIFDCIEFNDLLRFVDVAEDIGFLLMELDRYGLEDMARYFLTEFMSKFDDPDMDKILPFYKSYRAAVRIKVKLFRITELDEEEDKKEIKRLQQEANDYAKLAINYMEEFS